jgi:tetratricopeptide (TPR) repeat protein
MEQWEQLSPENPECAMLRVATLIALGEDAAATNAMEQLVRCHGGAVERARPIADLFALLGQWHASSEYAARAVEHEPNTPEPLLSAARAALELGNFEQCAEFCMDATERDMAIPEAHHLLGAALAWAGELEHAAQSFEMALKFAPKNYESLAFAAAVARARGNASAAAVFDAVITDAAHFHHGAPASAVAGRHTIRCAVAWQKDTRL